MEILNLTGVKATAEQIADGVIDPTDEDREKIWKLLYDFKTTPRWMELNARAMDIAKIAKPYKTKMVMLEAPTFFVHELTSTIEFLGMCPIYAFTRQEVVKKTRPDGSVWEQTITRHLGWVNS